VIVKGYVRGRPAGKAASSIFILLTKVIPAGNLMGKATLIVFPRETAMTTKPDFKLGDQVVHIGERQKRGVVSRVFRSGGVWWLAFEGEPDWRYSPRYFRRVA
jgi:hypothetical protein